MFALFEALPYEIRLEIFRVAANTEHTPRVIEVFYKDGQLYSKQQPPALLHVCQLSRHVVQKIYKPWLPQFAGTVAHKPWETQVKKKGVERLSKLQNVYIDMEFDILLLNSKIYRAGMLGEIEQQLLRNMAVEMDDWVMSMDIAKCARQCGGLKNLNLFEGRTGHRYTSFNVERIQQRIEWLAKKKLRKEPPYKVPWIHSETIKISSPEYRTIERWYQYKYPKGYKTPRQSSRPVDRSRLLEQEDLDLELEELKEASADLELLGGHPSSFASEQTTTTKRKEYTLDASQTSDANSRKSAKNSHSFRRERHDSNKTAASITTSTRRARPLLTPPSSSPIRAGHSRQQHNPQSVWIRPPKEFNNSYFDNDALSPSPSPEPKQSPQSIDLPALPPATPKTPVRPQHDPFHEWTELDWEPLLQPSSPPEQFTTPYIEQFIDIPPSPEQAVYIDLRNIWSALEDEPQPRALKESADMARSKRAIKPRNTEEVNEAEEERLVQLQLQAELANEDHVETSNANAQGPMTPESEVPTINVPESAVPESGVPETSGVPARIRAERQVQNEVQLLVQWKNYSEEKDWTWEEERELQQSAPKIVQAWRTKKNKETVVEDAVLEDEVEKILGKRKWKGEPHYLVKWMGYEDIESRTWEPCERLKVDVPDIVEAYESKSKKKGKARK
ncbi:hypothetical protein BKA64DRAFT_740105 [Cadophora sp. MPI-SDFR-AT-0126]|nr:hypothetical protein BKA64DRAFT_740105 [Leotiomycetes sp. MPI-SDFR-AT-0126]